MSYFQSALSENEINRAIDDTNEINTRNECRSSTIHDLCFDVWEQILGYFDVINVFSTFASITDVVNQVLYNENYPFLFCGLTIVTSLKSIPEEIPLNRIMSLTLHETASSASLKYCSELRSLKLIGEAEWITWTTTNMLQKHTKLCHLIIITSAIKSLSEILAPILSICSLRRLEIHTEEIEENIQAGTLATTTTSNIEQLIIKSSSMIDWNELSYICPKLVRICYLSIGLIDRHQKLIHSLSLHNLRTLVIELLEVPFDRIIKLVATMPCLLKLKITGLIDADGFVINQRWIRLFQAAPTLQRIFVHVSLEQTSTSFPYEKLQTELRALNLNLACDADEAECCLYYGNMNRWWSLSGIITMPSN